MNAKQATKGTAKASPATVEVPRVNWEIEDEASVAIRRGRNIRRAPRAPRQPFMNINPWPVVVSGLREGVALNLLSTKGKICLAGR